MQNYTKSLNDRKLECQEMTRFQGIWRRRFERVPETVMAFQKFGQKQVYEVRRANNEISRISKKNRVMKKRMKRKKIDSEEQIDQDKKNFARRELEYNEKLDQYNATLKRSLKADQKANELLKLQKESEDYIVTIQALLELHEYPSQKSHPLAPTSPNSPPTAPKTTLSTL